MKKLIITIPLLFLLTACPKEQEVVNMMEELKQDKTIAASLIDSRSFSTDSLLQIQNYFFHFGEKVHLLKEDSESLNNIKKYISKNGVSNFCSDFVIPVRVWKRLRNFCSSGEFNRCSSDINLYETTYGRMLTTLGSDLSNQIKSASACN